MKNPILIGFDGSEQSFDAVALGRALAIALHRPAVVATVLPSHLLVDTERAHEHAGQRFAAARPLFAHAIEVEFMAQEWPSAAGGLYAIADQISPEMIVVGSSAHGAAGRVLAGSVSQRLLQGAPCPVIVAPVGYHDSAIDLRTVGTGFDGSRESELALVTAARIASAARGALQVFTVAEPDWPKWATLAFPPGMLVDELREQSEQKLRAALELLPAELPARGLLLNGDPVESLTRRSEGLDLLVLGSRCYGPLRRVLTGSVSGALVKSASCPVMVVPRTARETRVERASAAPAQAESHEPASTGGKAES